MFTELTQLTDHLWVVQSRLFGTNSGVFLDNEQACLIDPAACADEIQAIARFVRDRSATVQAIVITHGHWDHILGPEHFPGVKAIAQAAYRDEVIRHETTIRREIDRWETGEGIHRESPFAIPQPDRTFAEEMDLTVGSLRLRLVHAPGHAGDALVVYHADSGTLWAGDMLSDLEIPFIIHSLPAYEQTLARLSIWDIRAMVPGHWQPTTDGAEIRSRLSADIAYLAELRENVERAIRQGMTMAEAVELCAEMTFRHRAANEGPHRLNVESVYAELGGPADPARVGWNAA